MKIAIVDDRPEDRTVLEGCIRAWYGKRGIKCIAAEDAETAGGPDSAADSCVIEHFDSAEDFLPAFRKGGYDLVFLDICMDEMNGIELAKELRAADTQLMIVFQTTAREYAFDAFPVHPFDYLIKPCRQDEVDTVMAEAERVLRAGDPEITVMAKSELQVPVRTISAAVASGRGVEIQLTNSQSLKTGETFRSISEKLGTFPSFLLINRGVIINMDHVLAPEGDCIRMKDGALHPVKVNGRGAVMKEFNQYMISRVERWQ